MGDQTSKKEPGADTAPENGAAKPGPGGAGSVDRRDVTGSKGDAAEKGPERRTEKPGNKGKGGERSDVTGSDKQWEKFQRERHVSPSDGVGFKHNDAKPAPGETVRDFNNRPEHERIALTTNKDAVITLHTSADRPGSEAYNKALAEQRGREWAQELRELVGVVGRIEIVAHGERFAREADKSPMSDKEPSDRDPEDKRSDPRYRTGVMEIRVPEVQQGVDPKKFEGQNVNDVYDNGKQIAKEKLDPLGEKVRAQVPLRPNAYLPDSTKDPLETGKNIIGIAKDTLGALVTRDPKDLPEKVAEPLFDYVAGVTGAKHQMEKEVEAKRNPYHKAIAEGAASGFDANHKSSWKPENGQQKALFDEAKSTVQGLSGAEKLQLGFFLTHNYTDWEKTFDDVAPKMDGVSFRGGVERYFGNDEHFNRR